MTDDELQPPSEFEREPVPPRAQLGFKSFIGMYAGEHTAGTELMIGPLFVAAGVSAFDLLVGLLLGNALAVLSWTLLCAPIATRVRLTLYYQLEKICGRNLVTLYNLANGVMFCFLAGAMVTVSATAVGVWFDFPMPGLNDLYPNSIGWVIAVAVVGLMIAVVAAYGYNTVAHIANLAAPWMFFVFVAFGLVGLRQFMAETDTQVRSLGDLWQLAQTAIWKGGDPLPGARSSPSGTSPSSPGSATRPCTSACPTCPCSALPARAGTGSRRHLACTSVTTPLGFVRRSCMPCRCTARRTIRTCYQVPWPPERAVWRACCA